MKTALIIIALAAVLAPGAYAIEQARDPRVPALQRQVQNLQSQINVLSADVRATQQTVTTVNDRVTCTTAITWDGIRLLAQFVLGGDIGRLDDGGACARIGVSRSPYFLQSRPDDPSRALSRLVKQLDR
jgi:outer membrane murein-binding lipoprotein Lpp